MPSFRQAALRHATHFGLMLTEASKLYAQGHEFVQHGLVAFDNEWGNIQTGQAWAAAHSLESRTIAQLARDYPDRGADLLDLRLHARERISWLESAIRASKLLNDQGMEMLHSGNLGQAYADLYEIDRAIDLYEQTLLLASAWHR